MSGDLPPKILLYFLTMVPLPKVDDSKPGDVFGMMKKTHDSLPKKYAFAAENSQNVNISFLACVPFC